MVRSRQPASHSHAAAAPSHCLPPTLPLAPSSILAQIPVPSRPLQPPSRSLHPRRCPHSPSLHSLLFSSTIRKKDRHPKNPSIVSPLSPRPLSPQKRIHPQPKRQQSVYQPTPLPTIPPSPASLPRLMPSYSHDHSHSLAPDRHSPNKPRPRRDNVPTPQNCDGVPDGWIACLSSHAFNFCVNQRKCQTVASDKQLTEPIFHNAGIVDYPSQNCADGTVCCASTRQCDFALNCAQIIGNDGSADAGSDTTPTKIASIISKSWSTTRHSLLTETHLPTPLASPKSSHSIVYSATSAISTTSSGNFAVTSIYSPPSTLTSTSTTRTSTTSTSTPTSSASTGTTTRRTDTSSADEVTTSTFSTSTTTKTTTAVTTTLPYIPPLLASTTSCESSTVTGGKVPIATPTTYTVPVTTPTAWSNPIGTPSRHSVSLMTPYLSNSSGTPSTYTAPVNTPASYTVPLTTPSQPVASLYTPTVPIVTPSYLPGEIIVPSGWIGGALITPSALCTVTPPSLCTTTPAFAPTWATAALSRSMTADISSESSSSHISTSCSPTQTKSNSTAFDSGLQQPQQPQPTTTISDMDPSALVKVGTALGLLAVLGFGIFGAIYWRKWRHEDQKRMLALSNQSETSSVHPNHRLDSNNITYSAAAASLPHGTSRNRNFSGKQSSTPSNADDVRPAGSSAGLFNTLREFTHLMVNPTSVADIMHQNQTTGKSTSGTDAADTKSTGAGSDAWGVSPGLPMSAGLVATAGQEKRRTGQQTFSIFGTRGQPSKQKNAPMDEAYGQSSGIQVFEVISEYGLQSVPAGSPQFVDADHRDLEVHVRESPPSSGVSSPLTHDWIDSPRTEDRVASPTLSESLTSAFGGIFDRYFHRSGNQRHHSNMKNPSPSNSGKDLQAQNTLKKPVNMLQIAATSSASLQAVAASSASLHATAGLSQQRFASNSSTSSSNVSHGHVHIPSDYTDLFTPVHATLSERESTATSMVLGTTVSVVSVAGLSSKKPATTKFPSDYTDLFSPTSAKQSNEEEDEFDTPQAGEALRSRRRFTLDEEINLEEDDDEGVRVIQNVQSVIVGADKMTLSQIMRRPTDATTESLLEAMEAMPPVPQLDLSLNLDGEEGMGLKFDPELYEFAENSDEDEDGDVLENLGAIVEERATSHMRGSHVPSYIGGGFIDEVDEEELERIRKSIATPFLHEALDKKNQNGPSNTMNTAPPPPPPPSHSLPFIETTPLAVPGWMLDEENKDTLVLLPEIKLVEPHSDAAIRMLATQATHILPESKVAANASTIAGGDSTPRVPQTVQPTKIKTLQAFTGPKPATVASQPTHVAKASFIPLRDDETAIAEGDLVHVYEEFADGWVRVVNLSQGKRTGFVPRGMLRAVKGRIGASKRVVIVEGDSPIKNGAEPQGSESRIADGNGGAGKAVWVGALSPSNKRTSIDSVRSMEAARVGKLPPRVESLNHS
ncbi:hypothetical protein BC830DRAFT_676577 [Chytriomyces sp. MP71]|nr:hypothetical protein BC830DRAFT_676577 [Chytriomyces sp. MP71]